MNSCTPGETQEICWFCRKGRHDDCMVRIPVQEESEGPHDCTFGTAMVPCRCGTCSGRVQDDGAPNK